MTTAGCVATVAAVGDVITVAGMATEDGVTIIAVAVDGSVVGVLGDQTVDPTHLVKPALTPGIEETVTG